MADPVSIELTDNGKIDLQASARGITLSANAPAAVLAAVAENRPFTAAVTVAAGELSAQGDGDFVFDGGAGKVTFKGSAQSGASLGVFFDPAQLGASLAGAAGASSAGNPSDGHPGLPEDLGEVLSASFGTPPLDDELLLALRWGYQIEAGADGTLALGASGSASFGFDGQSSGLFAVCRRLPRATGGRDAIEDLLRNWMLPRQVEAVSDLSPGTWLVAQIDGGLSLTLGARLGYDFSWVRGVELGELAGDVALKIELGVAASVGFDVAGRYALVVARESTDPAGEKLRVRLFRLGKRGWNFGFDLGAEVSPSTPQPDLDELVQAVFGVQAAQLLADLDRLADPQQSLTKLLADKAEGYLAGFFEQVTGLDVASSLAEANARLEEVLDKWNQLDHQVASKIWARLDQVDAIREIRAIAGEVAAAPDLRTLIAGKLSSTGFLSTAGAEWLEALAPKGLLELLDEEAAAQGRVRDAANRTLAVLDEATVEEPLGRLKGYLAERFGLDQVIAALDKAIAATDPGALDAWLEKKLETFFDQTLDKADPGLTQKLKQIQVAIRTVRDKAGTIWSKTLEALNRTYAAQFSFRYQSSTTRQALFDVVLDFAVDAAAAGEALKALLGGRFDTVLLGESPAVTVDQGTLAFGLSRQGSVDLTLPGFKNELTNLTTAWGQVTASEDNGRVLLYEAKGDNEVAMATARARRTSRLSVATNLPVAARGAMRVHQPGALRFSYVLEEAVAGLTADQFLDEYRGYADLYLPGRFPTDTGGGTAGSFAAWVRELDKASDAAGWGGGVLGNTLSSLEVALSTEVGRAWLAGVASGGDDALRRTSLAIQSALRRLVPFYYFQDVGNYDAQPAEPLLVYAAVPPRNAFTISAGGVLKPKPKGDVYWWDLNDTTAFDALVFSDTTTRALTASCLAISQVLGHIDGMGKVARRYAKADVRVRQIQNEVRQGATLRRNLVNVFIMEALVIHAAERAARQLAVFQSAAGDDPETAVEALTRFSADLADAFSRELWSVYGKSALRPLGTLVFLEAARVFSESLPAPDALLDVTILKPGVQPFPPAGFPDHAAPLAEQIAVRQMVTSVPPGE